MSQKAKWSTVQATEGKFLPGTGGKADRVVVTVRVVDGDGGIGTDREKFMYLEGEKAVARTMKELRALGWTCSDITVLTGLGSLKARMAESTAPNPKGGVFNNINFVAMSEPPSTESLREFAKKYQDAARGVEKIASVEYNKASNLPPQVAQVAPVDSELPF